MSTNLWLSMLAIALGTLLMRVLPMIWMQRHILKRHQSNQDGGPPTWLTVSGPTMIAAMLGVSLVPSQATTLGWIATAVGGLVTAIVWYWRRSLGWPVFAGVASYGLIIGLISI